MNQLEAHCKSAKALEGNETKIKAFEADLKSAATKAASSFDQRRSELADKFDKAEQHAQEAAQHANSVNETSNMIEALDKADAALAALRNVSREIEALGREQRRQVSTALNAVREKATGFAYKAARGVEKLADKVTDPLYSLGDSAEDMADKLSDKRTDLADCALNALERVDSKIHDRAESIEEAARKSLEESADSVHSKEAHLRTLVERAAARQAAFEAVLAARQGQDWKASFLPLALTAIAASACTALVLVRSKPTSSMSSPLLA
jgi:chromosome segregation ATPase